MMAQLKMEISRLCTDLSEFPSLSVEKVVLTITVMTVLAYLFLWRPSSKGTTREVNHGVVNEKSTHDEEFPATSDESESDEDHIDDAEITALVQPYNRTKNRNEGATFERRSAGDVNTAQDFSEGPVSPKASYPRQENGSFINSDGEEFYITNFCSLETCLDQGRLGSLRSSIKQLGEISSPRSLSPFELDE